MQTSTFTMLLTQSLICEEAQRGVSARSEKPWLTRVESAIQDPLMLHDLMAAQDLDWHDQRICEEVLQNNIHVKKLFMLSAVSVLLYAPSCMPECNLLTWCAERHKSMLARFERGQSSNENHLIHHSMEHIDGSIIGCRGKERVPGVERHPAQSLRVVPQRPVRLCGQVQVKPCQALVLHWQPARSHLT